VSNAAFREQAAHGKAALTGADDDDVDGTGRAGVALDHRPHC
jgi:hypothetical protein